MCGGGGVVRVYGCGSVILHVDTCTYIYTSICEFKDEYIYLHDHVSCSVIIEIITSKSKLTPYIYGVYVSSLTSVVSIQAMILLTSVLITWC